MRPSWDQTWMKIASDLAERSHDETFKVAALVVPTDNTRVLSLGYNGNYPGGPQERESDAPGMSGFIHAEVNSLVKLDFHDPSEKVMYVTLSPCVMCAKLILAARIREVVFRDEYRDTAGLDLLRKNGVKVRQFVPEDVKRAIADKKWPNPMPCSNCNATLFKGERMVTNEGKAYCNYDCAETAGEEWAQK